MPGLPRKTVRIFDTTLRDGEQSPGCSLTVNEKRQVARQLAQLGVDIIEAGFPATSPGDFNAVHAVATDALDWQHPPVICALARATSNDINAAALALKAAPAFRIHTFIATSELHLQYKLQLTHQEVLQRVHEMVTLAATFTGDVQFSAEDATRSDVAFLHDVLHTAIDAGATTINIPDTVGYTTPIEYAHLIRGIIKNVVNRRNIVVSTHCHDDLGLGVANSLAGVTGGATQVECTINGIGERAGNAALEEIVMALHTRADYYHARSNIHTSHIGRTSKLVSRCTGVRVPPNKAIIGANAFAHEAGIHQDGMLKHRDTYEIIRAEQVGLEGGRLVLGKHSGRAALKAHLLARGHSLDEQECELIFARFKELADKKKMVDDRELEAVVSSVSGNVTALYTVDLVQASCGTHAIPTATVRLTGPGGWTRAAAAQGDGPVDAVCRAINECLRDEGNMGELVEYTVDAAAEGISAVGGVHIRLKDRPAPGAEHQPHTASGYGVHTDIIVATAEAYVSAMNGLLRVRAQQTAGSTGTAEVAA